MKRPFLKYFLTLIGLFILLNLQQSFNFMPQQVTAIEYPKKQVLVQHQKQALSIDREWTLIWQDDFKGDRLNRSKWTPENGYIDKNNELQTYHPDQITIEQNQLKINTTENLYSGAIHTMGKFSFLYGRVEMRAKLPKGQGLFPAFWMMPNLDQTWLPEIDILELLGHEPDRVWMVVHWLENGQLRSEATSFQGPDYSENFHTFALEWTEDQLMWSIDGEDRFKTRAFVPDRPMYLYLNTAVGGDWPGPPDETTVFPQVFEIDYVRVYQRTEAMK